MMDAQTLIILSNIDGIYNGSPSDPDSSVIREIGHGKDLSNYIQASKSSFGRGGMLTKTNIARKVADEGITAVSYTHLKSPEQSSVIGVMACSQTYKSQPKR